MQSNVVAIRGARLRASFPHAAAREGERSLGLLRLSLLQPPQPSSAALRERVAPSPRRALAAELRPRTAVIVRPRPVRSGSRARAERMTWAPRPAHRGARAFAAGAPWPG